MRVLALCSYPVEAAATRFRLHQFVEPLRSRGIDLEITPFLSTEQFKNLYKSKGHVRKVLGLFASTARRSLEVFGVRKYDLIFVQREAMIFGPALFEWLFQKIGNKPMILDLDDATYVRYTSPTFGRLGSSLKFFGKTDKLIKRASTVICGNRFIAEYAGSLGAKTVVVPTVVDTDVFCPGQPENQIPVLGWIGTHSTFPFLRSLFPVLEDLSRKHVFRLKVVGAGNNKIEVKGVEVINLEWDLDTEVSDFQGLDIGLYPVTLSSSANDQWIQGKSGFKAIQYLAVGVPFVMSPVGVNAEIGECGKTHLTAVSPQDWYNSLDFLLSDQDARRRIGAAGREYSTSNYSVPMQAEILAGTFLEGTE